MKNWMMRGTTVCGFVMTVLMAAAPVAEAQLPEGIRVDAANLTVKKVYVRSQVAPGTIASGANLAIPMTVNCPKTGNCLLKIDASMQIALELDAILILGAKVDGQKTLPNEFVAAARAAYDGFSEARSYTWFAEVAPGDHTVNVYAAFATTQGVTVPLSSLTVSVLK